VGAGGPCHPVVESDWPRVSHRIRRDSSTVGTVDIWDIYRALPSERLEQFHAADSLEAIEFSEHEWWLNIYRDEFPKLFEERIESDVS